MRVRLTPLLGLLFLPVIQLHAQLPGPVITSFTVSGDAVSDSLQTATGTITIAPPTPGCNVEVGAGGSAAIGGAEIPLGSTTVSFPIYATQEVATSTTFPIAGFASFAQNCTGDIYYLSTGTSPISITIDPPTYQFDFSPNPVNLGTTMFGLAALTVTRSLPVFTGPVIVQAESESYYLTAGWNGPVLEYGGASCANQAGGTQVGIPPNGNVAQFIFSVTTSAHTKTISLPVCDETTPQPTQIGAPTLTVLGYLDIPPSPADLGPCTVDSCEAAVGSPINAMTGNIWIQEQDYSLPGLGGGLRLARTWNSQWQDITPVSSAGMFGNGWRSTYEEQLTFPSAGTITYWRNDGNAWTFTQGSNGSTYSVTSPPDQYASLTASSPSLYTIAFADGTQKLFNQSGQLTATLDRNGNQTNFTYSGLGDLTQIADPAGRTLTFNYADPINPGQATSIQDQVGTIATYTYDSSSRLVQVVYADGSSLNFTYDPSSSMILSVTDALGKVLESHTYDPQYHRGLTSVRANGVDSVSMDYANLLIYDSFGDFTSISYETIGGRHFIDTFNGPGCSSCGLRHFYRFMYDSQGNRLSAMDANGRTTSYTYDGSGNVLTKTDATGATWTYTYNQFGEVLTATDPAGNITTNIYDANGNLLSTTTPAPGGSAPASTTSFAYDPKGELVQVTDPRGAVTTLAYTPAGLLASTADAQGNATTFQYDGRGNRLSLTDPLGNVTAYSYDVMNRLTNTTQPGSVTTSFGYDYRGRRTSVTDPDGKTTQYAYDDADRLTSVTDAASHSTSYAYDTENNLLGITDALGRLTSFSYDASGQVNTVVFPNGAMESYSYIRTGELTGKTDRNGNTIGYSYDNVDRLLSKSYPDSTSVNYTYDILGRLTQAADASGTYSFSYDNLGRLTQTSTQYAFLSGQTLVNSYTYDANSNRASFANPQGGATSYIYDSLNRLTSETDFAGRLFTFGYDALGRRTGLTRPNGVNTSYTYDSLSRLLSVLHQSGNTTLDGAAYAYDAAGNRTSKTALPSNLASAYSYDPVYELTKVLQGTTQKESYTYDAVGNRTYQPGAPYTYNSANEMTAREGVPYTYDANGNTLSKTNSGGATTYTWDFENRLTSVTLPGTGGTVSFKYDPFGRRINKTSPAGETTYVYDGDNMEEELTGSTGTLSERYTYGPGIDEPLVGQRQPKIFYYEADGLGSVTSLTDPTGAVAATYTYDSFGFLTASTGSATNWYRYTARQFDSDTGLYYDRARYYDPTIGRFISEDPIRLAGGMNVYRYAKANPTNLIDPSGLSAINILVIPGTTTATTTQGILVVQVDGITKFQGNSLEPSGTDPNAGRLLPPGVYPAAPYFSPKLNYTDLLLSGTDPMTFVEIHIGNFAKNTEGCILPGLSASPDKVNESARAFEKIMNVVSSTQASDAATGQKTTITVTQF